MSSRLHCALELRTSNLKHKETIHHPANFVCGRQHCPTTFITLFVEGSIVLQLSSLFVFFWRTRFVFLDVLSLFCFVRYRNRAVSISTCCHFYDMSILFSSFESLKEATFSPLFLTSGLSGAHNLTTSRLKCKDSCFLHRQTLFLEESIVQQLLFTYFVLSTKMFCLFRFIESFLFFAISESGCLTFNVVSFS